MDNQAPVRIALIGAGTIGTSFAALHLGNVSPSKRVLLTIYDTRPDLIDNVRRNFPQDISPDHFGLFHPSTGTLNFLRPDLINHLITTNQLKFSNNLEEACYDADIIQESGPENVEFKSSLWPQIEAIAPPTALFWSSTSGIPASEQASRMKDPSRLVVVHPYNPPHIMPLLEIVPSPATSQDVINRTMEYWKGIGREPVLLKKECIGFVANRLAFSMFREAIHLVNEGVVSVEELDTIVQNSIGPRWDIAGPFKSYHAGGGEGGLAAFMKNIGGTVQACWNDSGKPRATGRWVPKICEQTTKAYGVVDINERNTTTRKVLQAVREEKVDIAPHL
ncbi:MAG: hypothetical protein M1834_000900 [Cirrosporium novae-zelandiae]|nr:MAG: hypothetical protein M1834_000900 [Cirrosporium novae-zelandiae]